MQLRRYNLRRAKAETRRRAHWMSAVAALAWCMASGGACAADYLDLRTIVPIQGDATAGAAKAAVCAACHGQIWY